MYKVVIVDDEQLATKHLKNVLNTTGVVDIIGKFNNSVQALEEIKKLNPNLIFLDIEMPGMTGLELAKKIRKFNLNSYIVFVSAYEKYAIKAFELGVTDYIMKPYTIDRVKRLLERLGPPVTYDEEVKEVTDHYSVHAIKHFHFRKNNKEIKNVKWRTAKSRELFIYLVQNSKEVVRKDILIDLLWPDLDMDSAYDNLYTSVYHIRKTLKDANVDIKINNTFHGYELDFHNVGYDVFEWEDKIDELENLLMSTNDTKEIMAKYNALMRIYQGHYLEEETYLWKENIQEQLRIKFLSISRVVISFLKNKKKYLDALIVSLHLQKTYPYLEDSYFLLMQLYDLLGDRRKVEEQYKSLIKMMKDEFGTKPDKDILNWYKNWLVD